ncbi:F1 complex, OSCP/delta subunit of ATPase [Gonapodya prolifera JEL478]|uniref:ATP synthase subunit 5, mitochondrial n=1 Tax=Gonapodya prolifera (strain JEL478) TaxID=1344416 RepID=A0A139AQ60_GONPJ|nr:F1 complex, OSCP/delta subunit of ATPase [Gonapodya prolifera JEL478]|eukprot:KXS18643.1 F1 complex, OSCP/delta subunit of ATPase [Gonapodya prolifera JEL478]
MLRNAVTRSLAQARTYATESGSQALPVLHGLDGRYATALFSAAQKSSVVETVERDLNRMKALLQTDEKFRFFVETPIIAREEKKAGIKDILTKGGYSAVTKNFFDVLADNGRLDQTIKIISSFETLLLASRGLVSCTVTSAKELDGATLRRVEAILTKSNLLEKGQKITVTSKINPSILGGLVIEIGDKTIDLSVSSKIAKLNRLLTETI